MLRMTEKEWSQFAAAHGLDPKTGKKLPPRKNYNRIILALARRNKGGRHDK